MQHWDGCNASDVCTFSTWRNPSRDRAWTQHRRSYSACSVGKDGPTNGNAAPCHGARHSSPVLAAVIQYPCAAALTQRVSTCISALPFWMIGCLHGCAFGVQAQGKPLPSTAYPAAAAAPFTMPSLFPVPDNAPPQAAAAPKHTAAPGASAPFHTVGSASKPSAGAPRPAESNKRRAGESAEGASHLPNSKRTKLTPLAEPASQESGEDDDGVENQQVMLMRMINTMMQACPHHLSLLGLPL